MTISYLHAFGRTTQTQVGSLTALSTTTYKANSNLPLTVKLASGYTLEYVYDGWDNLIEIKRSMTGAAGTFTAIVKYTYNAEGQLAKEQDLLKGTTMTYTYDQLGRVVQTTESEGNGRIAQMHVYEYDKNGNVHVARSTNAGCQGVRGTVLLTLA
ncbi:MAG: RHS repeat protein [Clostridiales bacterium]|nr:RHS repeat protein [Clostridiales bacterium]